MNDKSFRPAVANKVEDTENIKTVSYTHLDVYKRQMYVRLTMFVSKTESLYGEIIVHTVWHVSVAALKKRLNMESIAMV